MPIPPKWEPRRSKDRSVYFTNLETGENTACLWNDPLPRELRLELPKPLPKGWKQGIRDGKLIWLEGGWKLTETHPKPDKESLYQAVLGCREFNDLLEFFPQPFFSDLLRAREAMEDWSRSGTEVAGDYSRGPIFA